MDISHQRSPVQMLLVPRRAEARVSNGHAKHPRPPAHTGSIHRNQHMGTDTIEELREAKRRDDTVVRKCNGIAVP